MPAKPQWFARLDQILADLDALPSPWVTRGTVEFLFGVGPRRAQQLLARCGIERVGSSIVADRRLLIDHLRTVAHGEDHHYEAQRRRKLANTIENCRRDWLSGPKLLVEAPLSVVNQQFDELPPGIDLQPGRIVLSFSTPPEALEKLLQLAMAIGNAPERFEDLISRRP